MRDRERKLNTRVLTTLYLVFVVYGSLVPLDLRPLPLDDAVARFNAIRWLDLDAGSRGDLIANFILYLPIGFLLGRARSEVDGRWPEVRAIFVLLFGLALAVAVEFAQVWFPPRTQSLNDLASEAVGLVAGVLLRLRVGDRPLKVATAALAGGRTAYLAVLWCYFGAYVFFSLFPFDFVLQPDALRRKLDAGFVGWLIAGTQCARWGGCLVRGFVEVLEVVPIGLLLAGHGHRGMRQGALMGAALGILLEILQVFLYNGVSQGLSILTRAFGVAAGVLIGRNIGALRHLWSYAPYVVWGGLVPYLWLLLRLSGWLNGRWLDVEAGIRRFGDVRVLPFYYHYYQSEAAALSNLVANLFAYAPIGGAAVLLSIGSGTLRWVDRLIWVAAGTVAFCLALVLETGKLFLASKHPDFTNAIVAFAGAWLGAAATWALWRGVTEQTAETSMQQTRSSDSARLRGSTGPAESSASALPRLRLVVPKAGRAAARLVAVSEATQGLPSAAAVPRPPDASMRANAPLSGPVTPVELSTPAARAQPAFQEQPPPSQPVTIPIVLPEHAPAGYVVSILALIVVGLSIWRFPLLQVPVALLLAAYFAALLRVRELWLFVVPAALPIFDLAPLSGRFFWDEFDFLLLTTLAAGALNGQLALGASAMRSRAFLAVLALTVVGAGVGFASMLASGAPATGPNAVDNFFSPWNAWRAAKGALWALALFPMLAATLDAAAARAERFVAWGIVAGMSAMSAVIVWERMVFTGLADREITYRAIGSMSAMHTGGAYVEGLLVACLPFALWLAWTGPGAAARIAAIASMLLGSYAALVTYSRGAYLGLVAATFVFVVLAVLALPRLTIRRPGPVVGAISAIAGVILIVALLGQGEGIQGRFARISEDLATRFAHWERSLSKFSGDPLRWITGNGIGTFPEISFRRPGEAAAVPRYAITEQSGERLLRLAGGRLSYFEQVVQVEPRGVYTFKIDTRSPADSGRIVVYLCEKWLLQSARCRDWQLAVPPNTQGTWHTLTTKFESGGLGQGRFGSLPIKLTLVNPVRGTVLEVDGVSLRDPQGQELIRNGRFDSGTDHWFFSSDDHLAWHVKSLPLHVILESGLPGALLLLGVVLLSIFRSVRALDRGTMFPAAVVAGIAGMLTVGLTDSLIDAPRIAMVFFLLVLLPFARVRRAAAGALRRDATLRKQ